MSRFRDAVALTWLLIEGFVLALAIAVSDDVFLYVWTTIGMASWLVLFGAAVGRWHSRRGRIWLLALASPLCFLGPSLAAALPFKGVRTGLARDLTTTWRVLLGIAVDAPRMLMGVWRALARVSARTPGNLMSGLRRLTTPTFPLGEPTILKLLEAVAMAASAFVVVFLAMLMLWVAATAGGSAQERTFSASDWWFVLAPPVVTSGFLLAYLGIGWIAARRQTHRLKKRVASF